MTATTTSDIAVTHTESPRPRLDHEMGIKTVLGFLAVLALGLSYTAYSIYLDVRASGTPVTSLLPFLLLGVALLIALGFEFVNGFHDTANAVATVIYPCAPGSSCGGLVRILQFPRGSALDRRGCLCDRIFAAG